MESPCPQFPEMHFQSKHGRRRKNLFVIGQESLRVQNAFALFINIGLCTHFYSTYFKTWIIIFKKKTQSLKYYVIRRIDFFGWLNNLFTWTVGQFKTKMQTASNLTGRTSNSIEPKFVYQNWTSNPSKKSELWTCSAK